MKKILVLITVIVLMLSMVGCTSSDDFVIEEFSILDITDTGCIIAPISDTGEVLAVHKYSIQNIFNKRELKKLPFLFSNNYLYVIKTV